MLAENLSSLSAEQGNELNRIDHGNPAWRALSAFATEQHHAFRHAFDSEPAVETTGQVHHQQETCTTDQVNFTQSADQLSEAERAHAHESRAVQHKTALQAEVDRIQQRIALLNPEKEVVVQLDFISGGASRAASIAVTSSLVIAATVLLAQVIKKFELVSAYCPNRLWLCSSLPTCCALDLAISAKTTQHHCGCRVALHTSSATPCCTSAMQQLLWCA